MAAVKNTRLNSYEVAGFMKNALDSSLSGIIIKNREGLIIYVNSAILEMFEYDNKAEVIAKSAVDLFDSNRGDLLGSFMVGTDQEISGAKEFMAQTGNGLLIPVEVAVSNAIDSKGKVVARMISFIDITERKLLEKKRIRRGIEQSIGVFADKAEHNSV